MPLNGNVIERALKAAGASTSGLVASSDEIADLFTEAIQKYGKGQFNSVNAVAALISECMIESAWFQTTTEYTPKTGWYDWQDRYEPYIGRTFIQITWRDNYEKFGKWCVEQGLFKNWKNFVEKPERLSRLKFAAIGAVWYFTDVKFHGKPLTAYVDNIDHVGKAVNLGDPFSKYSPNGERARREAYNAVKSLGRDILVEDKKDNKPKKDEDELGHRVTGLWRATKDTAGYDRPEAKNPRGVKEGFVFRGVRSAEVNGEWWLQASGGKWYPGPDVVKFSDASREEAKPKRKKRKVIAPGPEIRRGGKQKLDRNTTDGRQAYSCGCVATTLPLIEAQMLEAGVIKYCADFTQASYNKSVGASGGTHDKGGAMDQIQRDEKTAEIYTDNGWVFFIRDGKHDWNGFPHAHGFPQGCPHLSRAARKQYADWKRKNNALAYPSRTYTGPWKVVSWKKAFNKNIQGLYQTKEAISQCNAPRKPNGKTVKKGFVFRATKAKKRGKYTWLKATGGKWYRADKCEMIERSVLRRKKKKREKRDKRGSLYKIDAKGGLIGRKRPRLSAPRTIVRKDGDTFRGVKWYSRKNLKYTWVKDTEGNWFPRNRNNKFFKKIGN